MASPRGEATEPTKKKCHRGYNTGIELWGTVHFLAEIATVPGIAKDAESCQNASVRREGNMDSDSFSLETSATQYFGSEYPPSGGHGPPGLPGGRDGAGTAVSTELCHECFPLPRSETLKVVLCARWTADQRRAHHGMPMICNTVCVFES